MHCVHIHLHVRILHRLWACRLGLWFRDLPHQFPSERVEHCSIRFLNRCDHFVSDLAYRHTKNWLKDTLHLHEHKSRIWNRYMYVSSSSEAVCVCDISND